MDITTRNFLLALALAGCGGDGATTMGATCDGESKGFTRCAGENCQPGQYCGRNEQENQHCRNGCLSDTNCACGQSCTKPPGSDVGSCSLGTTTGPTPTPANCVAAPDQKNYPGGVCCPSGAPSGCIAVPAADSLCASVGLPPKAYRCGGGGTTGSTGGTTGGTGGTTGGTGGTTGSNSSKVGKLCQNNGDCGGLICIVIHDTDASGTCREQCNNINDCDLSTGGMSCCKLSNVGTAVCLPSNLTWDIDC